MLGEIKHIYWMKEFQACGALHYHIHVLLWISDTSVIGQDKQEDVVLFIKARITCHLTDNQTCPELHHLVTGFQFTSALHTASEIGMWVAFLLRLES